MESWDLLSKKLQGTTNVLRGAVQTPHNQCKECLKDYNKNIISIECNFKKEESSLDYLVLH